MNQPYIYTYLLLFGLPSHPVHWVEFPVLYSMFSLVICFRQSIKERRSWWRKETNPEDTVHPWSVSIAFPVGGYLPFAVLYSILNILFHIHLWTMAWLFLTLTCHPFSGRCIPTLASHEQYVHFGSSLLGLSPFCLMVEVSCFWPGVEPGNE